MRMMIMAGGTGGHVIPALAVARDLLSKGVEVCWIGTPQGLESNLVKEEQIQFDSIDIKGLRKSGIGRKLAMPFIMAKALIQSLRILMQRRPNAILGMGGFVSGPGGLVAALLRLPIVLHEQNTVAGLTNRWLARLSVRNLTGFPRADGIKKFQFVGNPVRPELANLPDPETRLSSREGPLKILIIGGSQGAQVFNDYLPELLSNHSAPSVEVHHQSGAGKQGDIQQRYDNAGISAQVIEFIDDMASAYAWSDLVICRSGAMTVSEICCAGAVGVFVPYPHAVNDHQATNAEYLVGENAAIMVRQDQFVTGEWLNLIARFREDRTQLIEIARLARKLSRPNATSDVADFCLEAINA